MRIIMILLVATCLAACRTPSQGPGATCVATQAEAQPVPDGGQAAAAAASGGQRANNAPFAEDTARLAPRTQITRGQGSITSNSADSERREVASGGAQNLGLLIPTAANAENNGGGVSAAVQEAAKTVAAARRAYQLAIVDPTTSDARLQFLADQISAAQEALNAASASSRANITNNYNMGGDNTLIGYSKSGTGPGTESDAALKTMETVGSAAVDRKADPKKEDETSGGGDGE